MNIKEILSLSVEDMGFTKRTTGLLLMYGICSLRTVLSFDEEQYLMTHGFDRHATNDMQRKIALLNIPELHLGMSESELKELEAKTISNLKK